MSIFDVRGQTAGHIDTLVFSDVGYGFASRLKMSGGTIYLEDTDGDNEASVLPSDIGNLILALQKAKELGWDTK